jgi:quinoprotein glucose dehydrogenase
LRPGDDRDADSVVAIDAKSGKKAWAFQVVHHDLWDYDVASEPLLFAWHGNTPAVAITTKMGMVFVLDRRTGRPLYPIEERAVPQSDVPGEHSSPTQPFSSLPSLTPLTFPMEQGFAGSPEQSKSCLAQIERLRYQGVYTPPSLSGTLVFPGSIGGVNWGSAAYDPKSGILYANVNRVPYSAQLLPQLKPQSSLSKLIHTVYILRFAVLVLITVTLLFLSFVWRRMQNRWGLAVICTMVVLSALTWHSWTDLAHRPSIDISGAFGEDHSPQSGAPYSLYRHPILDSNGLPCMPGLFGTVAALNLQTGRIAWEQPHGSIHSGRGAPSLGGVIVTGGGLVFSAGTRESSLRAYDSSTGQELWTGSLPRPAQSTPMTYVVKGKQYVVIAAGGHGLWGTQTGDSLVAFALN